LVRPAREDPGQRQSTMQDIAREAGVSQSTVSRVLNDRSTAVPIAPETRERVLAVAKRLEYQPNPLARALRGAPTMLLGVIVRDITDPFFAIAVEALTTHAAARGYNVVLGTAHGRADEAIALHAVLETRHCDAIVVLGDMRDQPRLIDDLRSSPARVVGLWQGDALDGVPTVNVDNRLGIRLAMAHLVGLGHSRIAFVGGRLMGDIRERRAAYLECLAERGILIRQEYLHDAANDPAGGDAALRALIALPERPTAILASTDYIAFGVLHAAYIMGIAIPGDISVAGFDDLPMARYGVPALTTIAMPIVDMTALAVALAIGQAGTGDGVSTTTSVVEPSLVVRASTGRAA
jgi:DNA-binding LacI/PurR family transcriptional regulator